MNIYVSIDAGHVALVLSCLLSLYASFAGCIAGFFGNKVFLHSARNALLVASLSLAIAFVFLSASFLFNLYKYSYVWQTSSNDLAWFYRLSAVWGGMDGSMLCWCFILSVAIACVVSSKRFLLESEFIWFTCFGGITLSFSNIITLLFASPFRLMAGEFVPVEGKGLNPILQHPAMLLHPPLLYAGYAALSVPYLYCISALISGDFSTKWVNASRVWGLCACGFLSAGIFLGAYWSYIELGWGGIWAWDPVENSSLLPLLSCLAFIHTGRIYSSIGSFKRLTVIWGCLPYILAVFGMYITRSGIVQSLHAFGQSEIGEVLFIHFIILITIFIISLFYRWNKLKSDVLWDKWRSVEWIFFILSFVIAALLVVILVGTIMPILSKLMLSSVHVVGAKYYNLVTTPFFIVLIALFAFLPIVNLRKWRVGVWLSHIGFVIIAIFVAISCIYKSSHEFELSIGARKEIGVYVLKLENVTNLKRNGHDALVANVSVMSKDNELIDILTPELRIYRVYPDRDEITSEIAIHTSLLADLYVAVAGVEVTGRNMTDAGNVVGVRNGDFEKVIFRVYLTPYQIWVWIGGVMFVVGVVFVCLTPKLYRFQKLSGTVEL